MLIMTNGIGAGGGCVSMKSGYWRLRDLASFLRIVP